ncbi:hypothetical protein FK529_00190 [Tsukamurella asaccharolytica]|uniref:MspA family porin n=1 Tax=Tsukamurella asaccharolytica TaxID=2592067 RepID=A0A5C5REI1_9ACTN|nr:hypothetical protein FK529_00190 [Tsukamurella asaccharolytica]
MTITSQKVRNTTGTGVKRGASMENRTPPTIPAIPMIVRNAPCRRCCNRRGRCASDPAAAPLGRWTGICAVSSAAVRVCRGPPAGSGVGCGGRLKPPPAGPPAELALGLSGINKLLESGTYTGWCDELSRDARQSITPLRFVNPQTDAERHNRSKVPTPTVSASGTVTGQGQGGSGGGQGGGSVSGTGTGSLSGTLSDTVTETGNISGILKPGTTKDIPYAKKAVDGPNAQVMSRDIRIAVDNCIGGVQVRTYATVAISTEATDDTLTTFGKPIFLPRPEQNR